MIRYKERQNFKNILRKYKKGGNENEIITKYAPSLNGGNVADASEKLEEYHKKIINKQKN